VQRFSRTRLSDVLHCEAGITIAGPGLLNRMRFPTGYQLTLPGFTAERPLQRCARQWGRSAFDCCKGWIPVQSAPM